MANFDDLVENIDKPKTYVAIILDRSSSMWTMKMEAIDGFNEQLRSIKEMEDKNDIRLSLITFSSNVDDAYIWNKRPKDIEELSEDTYKPNGMTALNDAIGQTVEKLKKVEDKDDENTSFLIVIVSDGHENNSKEYKQDAIKELIEGVQKTNKWTFTFLGTNQDMVTTAEQYSIPIANTLYYNNTGKGMAAGYHTHNIGTSSYFNARSKGKTSVDDFYSDNSEEKE